MRNKVGTNANSVDYSVFEPMTDNFRNVVQEGIEEVYDTFLERVAQGRHITVAQADSMAQGRVWSGVDAKRLGLVDELGTLDDAIAGAASLADLGQYGIKKYPRYKTGFEKLMEDLGGASSETKSNLIKEEIGTEFYAILKQFQTIMQQKGVQARMPFALDIEALLNQLPLL